jgi:hypothetical protein
MSPPRHWTEAGRRSGIQLGEASSRLPECLVQLLWVGEDGHHQGVNQREPTQPLLFVATQRLREHQIQMLKKCEDGLVVHHKAACLGTSPLVERALPTVRLLQLHRRNAPVVAGLLRQANRRCRSGGNRRPHRLHDERPYQPSRCVRRSGNDDLNLLLGAAQAAWDGRRGAWAEFGETLLSGYEYRAYQRHCLDLRDPGLVGRFDYFQLPPSQRVDLGGRP